MTDERRTGHGMTDKRRGARCGGEDRERVVGTADGTASVPGKIGE